MTTLSSAINNAVAQVEHVRQRLELDQEAAEEALTDWFEAHLVDLAERHPKRRFEASSGMGSLSVEVSGKTNPSDPKHHPNKGWVWLWGVGAIPNNRGLFYEWAKEWEAMLDEFAARVGLEYVNFSRTVVVCGKEWQASA